MLNNCIYKWVNMNKFLSAIGKGIWIDQQLIMIEKFKKIKNFPTHIILKMEQDIEQMINDIEELPA
jgi:hypothetical protein